MALTLNAFTAVVASAPSAGDMCSAATRANYRRRRGSSPARQERLFDPSRDPKELVTREDWHPSRALADDDAAWIELDLSSTVESRRRWYRNLLDDPVFGGPKV